MRESTPAPTSAVATSQSGTSRTPTATLTTSTTTAARPSPDTGTTTETATPRQSELKAAKLAAADGDADDLFGWSVAISGDGSTAAIGARNDEDPNGAEGGSAYVFAADGDSWRQQAKLVADDGDGGEWFGSSVAMSDDGSKALVGAREDRGGSAYVFAKSGDSWRQTAKLVTDDRDPRDKFGVSVSMSSDGSTALVGAYLDGEPNGRAAGSAYVFTNDGGSWHQQAKLVAEDGDSDDLLGWSVAMSGDGSTALVGALWDEDPNGERSGSAYVFTNDGGSWRQQTKLTVDDGDSQDHFGSSVGLNEDGSTALVGAQQDENATGTESGAAYVFTTNDNGWPRQAKLTADDGGAGESFGSSVAMSDDASTVLVGASGDWDPNGDRAGSTYVFERTAGNWTQQAKLVPGDGDSQDYFGWSVATNDDGSAAIVGASRDEDPNGEQAGAAYLFDSY